jgi:hypothetical protein
LWARSDSTPPTGVRPQGKRTRDGGRRACHDAGHALACLEVGRPVLRVSLVDPLAPICADGPPTWADGRAATGAAVSHRHMILDEALVSLVGPLAEELERALPADRGALAAALGEPGPEPVRGARRLPEPEPPDPHSMPPWPHCNLARSCPWAAITFS